MSKKFLVAYFSCSGVTAKVAKSLVQLVDADIYEIKPEIPYTNADLNWRDNQSRSSIEMNDPSYRPGIIGKVSNMDDYDAVFVGFPIWWYVAPTIINTFLETYDFSGKKIIPFATSGGSNLGQTVEKLKSSCSDTATWFPGKLLNGRISKEILAEWINKLNI